ncbi:UDP-galactopyranose mutase [Paenibacillus dendritiformis]|uniref:UDP-galactopyranose mutase n=1 Tax=Paenibacillus dendritiformis TaxID=130049 RepID=UPI00366092CA
MFDYVIVGAGFSGAVIAERIATQMKKKVLLIEKRNHIGGNAFDEYSKEGLLTHRYGPHIFHTKMEHVWNYLSQFTDWYLYEHQVLGNIDGQLVPIPFNLNSLHALFPTEKAISLERKLVNTFGYNIKVPILRLNQSADEELKELANYVYEKVFLHYTLKQWGMTPEQLSSHVTGRVPVHISRDNRYFQDTFQGLPKNGYTRLFEKMLHNPNIKLMLNTDFKEVVKIDESNSSIHIFGQPFKGHLFFTGKLDELFQYRFGKLPYRSLRFEFETLHKEYFQNIGTVNYPNNYQFTRITEFKHLTGQKHQYTSIVREYPQEYNMEYPGKDIPYYPIPNQDNHDLAAQYRGLSKLFPQMTLLGRLAEYTYYDMDAVIAKALKVFEGISNEMAGDVTS